MLLKKYLADKQAKQEEIILLKHYGAKEPFCCRSVSLLDDYELGMEVIGELPTDNIQSYLYKQDKLDLCKYHLVVSVKTTTTIKLNKSSIQMLKDYVTRYTDLSVNQFILNAIAEKLEDDGEHFFWIEHSENK